MRFLKDSEYKTLIERIESLESDRVVEIARRESDSFFVYEDRTFEEIRWNPFPYKRKFKTIPVRDAVQMILKHLNLRLEYKDGVESSVELSPLFAAKPKKK